MSNQQSYKRKYRSYMFHQDLPVPKTSEWRHRKAMMPPVATQWSGNYGGTDGKKKAYLHDGDIPVPRQTLWYWKRRDARKVRISVDDDSDDDDNADYVGDHDTNDSDADDNDIAGNDHNSDVGHESSHDADDHDSGDGDDSGDAGDISDVDGNYYDSDVGVDADHDTQHTGHDESTDCDEHEDPTNTTDDMSNGCDDGDTVDGSFSMMPNEGNTDAEEYDSDDFLDGQPAVSETREAMTYPRNGKAESGLAPLYEGSSISTVVSWYTMMQFAVSNRLSYKAIEDLIALIKAHCPASSTSNCPASLYEFKQYFNKLNKQTIWNFCSVCFAHVDEGKACMKRNCIKNKASVCDLALFSIEDRLKQLYDEHDQFNYPFKRNRLDDLIQDIYDGSAVQQLMDGNGFLSFQGNTGLVLCSDGVPVYKSSKGSLWPVYLMATSIPPDKRMKVDNLIVAALWHGPSKPPMNTLLDPILSEISDLETTGIRVTSTKIIKAKLLMGVFDLPAKSSATNTKQFNGEYGCLYCMQKGEVYNRARVYRPMPQIVLKHNHEMKKWASKADESGEAQFGVKGSCSLGKCLEIPECIPIDYMHSILEGVFKQLMKQWFDAKFHAKSYSLRKHMPSINRLLSQIKPVSEIQRAPRSLEYLSFYKASEYRAWLLFYSLPILSLFLPPDYLHHLSLLVSSLHILLSDKIRREDLDIAHKMLSTFYQTSGELYSDSIYTANMHSLIHTVPFVRLWGPLWVYSMFGFENLNGYLGTTFHGTRRIIYQMSFQLQLMQTLPKKLLSLSKNECQQTQDQIKKLVMKNKTNMHDVSENCCIVGKISEYTFTLDELTIIRRSLGISLIAQNVQKFQKLILNHTTFCPSKVNGTRNNSFCMVNITDGHSTAAHIGEILSFYKSEYYSQPIAILRKYAVLANTPISDTRPPMIRAIRSLDVHSHVHKQFIELKLHDSINTEQVEIVAVPIQCIMRKCVLIKLKFSRKLKVYCIPLPNSFELH